MRKRLLLVHQTQYGYHTGNIQYCKYLKKEFEITFLCWDYNKERIIEPGIKYNYVSRKGNIIIRNLRFIISVLRQINQDNFFLVFVHYFTGSMLIPLLCKKGAKVHLDVRTGSVSSNLAYRTISNLVLKFESFFFKSQSVISDGLRKFLCLKKNTYILPLGANSIIINRRILNEVHLLYVGVLSERNLEDTIEGLNIFIKEQPTINIKYSMVGDGFKNEKEIFQKRITSLGLQSIIKLYGYIPYENLSTFYKIANVGVSYIPITTFFNYQPVTKTYEYLLAGMPVLATQTFENRKVINKNNGILINDTPNDFAKGIAEMVSKLNEFDEQKIRTSAEQYEWNTIIQRLKEDILS